MVATMIVRAARGIAPALPCDPLRQRIARSAGREGESILPTALQRALRGRRLFAAVIPSMAYISTGTEIAKVASE